MSNSKIDLVYDLVKEIDRKQDDQSIKLAHMEKDISQNTADLEHHVKRTDLLEDSLELQKKAVNQRFKKIEEPRVFFSTSKKYFLILGSLAGAGYAIARFWPYLKNLF